MKIALFGSEVSGQNFNSYSTHLTKKDGSSVYCRVKFKKGCAMPDIKTLPAYIIVKKENANLTERIARDKKTNEVITSADGEVVINRTLWISQWAYSDEKYIDHSLDDYDDME